MHIDRPVHFLPSRTLRYTLWGCLILIGVALMGLWLDPRQVLGMPAWSKTFKFAVSLALYALTLNWMIAVLPPRARLIRNLFKASTVLIVLEVVLIVVQTVRGVPSHFNISTPLDTLIWGAMGSMIVVFFVLILLAMVLMCFQRGNHPVLMLGMRLGLFLSLLGFLEGYLMTAPNALQQAALNAGQQLNLVGAHTVGVLKDGGPGLPLIGWSTTHGDLRIAHFFGTHAMQVLPLLALYLTRIPQRRMFETTKMQLLWVWAAGYLGLVGLQVWQALRNEPFLNPSMTVLLSGAGLVALVVAGTWGVIQAGRVQTLRFSRSIR